MAGLRTIFVSGTALLLLPCTLAQDERPRDTDLVEEVEVHLVLVDVLVLDSRGRTVPDLTREDFELYVDRKWHEIDTLDVACPAGVSEDPRPVGRKDVRPPPVVPDLPRRIALVVDYQRMSHMTRAMIADDLRRVVEKNKASEEELMIAALTTRLRIEQPFTSDRRAILETIDRMAEDPSLWQEPWQRTNLTPFGMSPIRHYTHEFKFFEALNSILALLQAYDGPKAIVLLSDLPEKSPPTGGLLSAPMDFDYDRQFELIATTAAKARTPLYPIHSRGLEFAKDSSRLNRLAVESGGRFTRGTNDLSVALARAQRDLACRYTIGFYGPEDGGKRPHTVSLRVLRPGLRAHHPSLFLYGPSKPTREALDSLAYLAPASFAGESVRVAVLPLRPLDRRRWEALVVLDFPVEVPTGAAHTVRFGAKIDRHDKVAHAFDRWVRIEPEAARRQLRIVFVDPVKLRPGAYDLEAVVADPGAAGPQSTVDRVELPEIPETGVVVAQPVLFRRPAEGDVVYWEDSPAESIEPLTTPNVEPDVPLAAETQICAIGRHGPGRPIVAERSLLLADGSSVATLQSELVLEGTGAVRCARVAEDLPALVLGPGDYAYRVVVNRGDETVRRAAGFTIDELPPPDEPLRSDEPPPHDEPPASAASARPVPVREPVPEWTPPRIYEFPPAQSVLDGLADMAEIYRGNALRFTADETTKAFNYFGDPTTPPKMTLSNVYFYYRTEDGELRDRRVRKSIMKELQAKSEDPDDIAERIAAAADPMTFRKEQIERKVPFYVIRPYGWIQVFSRRMQPHYHYLVEPTDRPGVALVEFEPKDDVPFEDAWHGTVQVDLASYQLLHAEGLHARDWEQQMAMEAMLDSPEDAPLDVVRRTFLITHVKTEFDIEERGLRFPSRVVSTIQRYRVRGEAGSKKLDREVASEITQTFRNYRFYGVTSLAEIMGWRE